MIIYEKKKYYLLYCEVSFPLHGVEERIKKLIHMKREVLHNFSHCETDYIEYLKKLSKPLAKEYSILESST